MSIIIGSAQVHKMQMTSTKEKCFSL